MNSLKAIIYLLVLIFSFSSFGTTQGRVLEVEEKIKGDIERFLDKFYQDSKFSVQVDVSPLRRTDESYLKNDDLPFMDYQDDLIIDEWDNPKVSIFTLYSRIKEVEITLYLDKSINNQNYNVLKDSILKEANLIPGRDIVKIELLNTPTQGNQFNLKDYTEIFLLGIMIIIAVILGVGLNSLSKKLVKPKSEGRDDSLSPQQGTPRPSPFVQPNLNQPSGGNIVGDLNIQDPSKINEIVSKKIEKLVSDNSFPTMKDMVELERLLLTDSTSFSYLVYEFPQDIQKVIYQNGRGENWFKGFSEVGLPSKTVLITLDSMIRNREVNFNKNFESLLTHCWRLGEKLPTFLKSIDKVYAFDILYFLPKDESIPAAREVFPGAWGNIFDHKNAPAIDTMEAARLIEETLNYSPYLDYNSLQEFKHRKDLLNYLDKVEPKEERDIYSIIGEDKQLVQIRPPFFQFFELDKIDKKSVFDSFPISSWAIACFNVNRQDRDKLFEILSDKEKYLLGHHLKSLDETGVNQKEKQFIRKEIAQITHKYTSDNAIIYAKEDSEETNEAA